MTIKHKPTVATYVANQAQAIAMLENLLEFLQTTPTPDENGRIPNIDYGYTGSFAVLVDHIREASRISDELSK